MRWKAIGLLGVALRAEPRDLAVSVHPVVGICLAGEAEDFALFAIRVIGLDFPFIVCNADGLEGHFCFCHSPLCRQWPQKRTRLAADLRGDLWSRARALPTGTFEYGLRCPE
jgi:hypothetical protein